MIQHRRSPITDDIKSAKFNKEQVTVIKGANLIKTYILLDTTSGVEKHKLFCDTCGCTLWTIPMKHNGDKIIVRTALIDDGYVHRLSTRYNHIYGICRLTPYF